MLAGRRLITLLFDVSSMQPEDVQRAVDSANKYVDKQMSPADLVAVATVGITLSVLTDFTADRAKVARGARHDRLHRRHLDRRRGGEHRGHRRGRGGRDRRHDDDRRDRTRHVQQRRAAARAEDARRGAVADRAEEGDPLLQRRHAAKRRRTTRSSCDRRSTPRCAPTSRSMRSTPADCRRSSPAAMRRQASGRGQSLFSGRGVQQQFEQLASSQDTLDDARR